MKPTLTIHTSGALITYAKIVDSGTRIEITMEYPTRLEIYDMFTNALHYELDYLYSKGEMAAWLTRTHEGEEEEILNAENLPAAFALYLVEIAWEDLEARNAAHNPKEEA